MYELKMIAVQTPAGDGSNMTAGPSYEYVDSVKARPHESGPDDRWGTFAV
jgi:hypothetical protein